MPSEPGEREIRRLDNFRVLWGGPGSPASFADNSPPMLELGRNACVALHYSA